MRSVLALVERAGGWLAAILSLIAGVALFALVPLAGWLVFGRYVLNASPTWVEPASLLLILIVTFAIAASATWRGDHLAITFVRDAMPRPVERALRVAAHSAMIVFGAAMAYASWVNVERTWSRPIPLLDLPEGARHLPLVVGGVGIVLFSAVHLVAMCLGRDEPSGPSLAATAPLAAEGDEPAPNRRADRP